MYFVNADDFQGTLGVFLAKIMDDPTVGDAFASTNALVKIIFTEPDTIMWIDCRQPVPSVSTDPAAVPETEVPDMVLNMSADNGHRFWLGRLSLPVALTSRKVKVKGPTSMLMKLLPAFKPVYRGYEEFLLERGRQDLVSV
ncbi:SCP2 sterol-binding domain-containing protein [Pseudonocardia bannensis]|uniref:SCP2 sterol-binding domain-containing protein n=1 Tax=Pseudonocardia bannensis TaxID=630973 RepID=A0A848DK25_9PSEU|nr:MULTISPECIES: SCP2 sterol-binding domain-containing protein [Pseudonocardia]NMH92899.1 SCP2 sterol-binding domain-containing protein [Pseudonocardia bannensis]